jgi:hypothetical protein
LKKQSPLIVLPVDWSVVSNLEFKDLVTYVHGSNARVVESILLDLSDQGGFENFLDDDLSAIDSLQSDAENSPSFPVKTLGNDLGVTAYRVLMLSFYDKHRLKYQELLGSEFVKTSRETSFRVDDHPKLDNAVLMRKM